MCLFKHRNILKTIATCILLNAVLIVCATPKGAAQEKTSSKSANNSGSWASFRNGSSQRGISKTQLPKNLELLWKFPAPDGVTNTAAIIGGKVYVGMLSGDAVCLDKKTGKLIWKYRSIKNPDPKEFAPGFQSSPTVTEKSVFLGDEDGVFHAIDRDTGKQQWTFQTDAEIVSSASVVGEKVIFGSYDSILYCLNKNDGSLIWKYQTEDRVNCSPAISDHYTFVAGCDEHLRVIDINDGQQVADIPLETYLIASPAVVGDQLYVGTYASEVLSVNWKEKTIDWRYKDLKKDQPYHASAAVTDEIIIIGGHDKQIHAIDRKTGKSLWKAVTRGGIDSSPAIVGQQAFIGSNDGNLYGFNIKTGKETFKYNIGKRISGGPAIGEECLVIGSDTSNGFVYCFGKK